MSDSLPPSCRIPDDKTQIDEFSPIKDALYEDVRALMEEGDRDDDWPLFRTARAFYADCADEEARDAAGAAPAERVLAASGGWPLSGPATKPWYRLQAELADAGLASNLLVLTVSVGVDVESNERRSIYIGKPTLGLDRQYLLNDTEESTVHQVSYCVQ